MEDLEHHTYENIHLVPETPFDNSTCIWEPTWIQRLDDMQNAVFNQRQIISSQGNSKSRKRMLDQKKRYPKTVDHEMLLMARLGECDSHRIPDDELRQQSASLMFTCLFSTSHCIKLALTAATCTFLPHSRVSSPAWQDLISTMSI